MMLLFREMLTEILPKYYEKVSLKVNIFFVITDSRTHTLRIPQECSCPWALKSAHEHS